MLDTKFWEKYFEVYDVLNLVIPYQELLRNIADELEIKNGERILEAGAGTGNLAIEIKKRGGMPVALDNIQEALNIYKKKDPAAIIVLADLTEKLPFVDNEFDKICSNNTIYAVPRKYREQIMKEFYRVLKPGGKIVIANIHKEFKPIKIYLAHIKQDIKKTGLLGVIIKGIKLMVPTIKMFYYNAKIKGEHKTGDFDFLEFDEQKELLSNAGFRNVSENKSVYAQQGILNSGYK
jgi:ubiquinone/menaquinone biosynthesis C-methylase UbiE